MLSFNNLGNLGRLGNQMFQYASLKGISTNRGFDFCIPPKEGFGQKDPMVSKDLNLYDIFDLQKINEVGLTQNKILQERTHTFDEELFDNCPDNIDLFGYYQTEKYFKHIEDEIRSDFSFNCKLYDNCKEFINSLNSQIISLHIRRGDYLTNLNHPTQTLDYYKKALELFPNNIPVLVFSDDWKWCNEQSIFESDRFMISQKSSVDADLCMMAMCNYHIIANSSFSWWGAWLADSQKIIAPKNWFSGNCIHKDVKDMKFGNWIWI
jgi:tetratricopeptide (TPR) repeat protein